MYHSQHGEDMYLDTLFPHDYKGVCIEVGAYNGVSLSNTYYFEKKGWRCLCIEPITSAFEKCKSIRKECYQCCISDNDKEDATFNIFHLHDNLCAISSLEPDERLIESHKHLITQNSTQTVKVRGLTSLMDELNFPREIDFISIDTENTELDVLKGIDFTKYNIRYLVIENNFDEPFCEEYLIPFGYKKIYRIAVNDFYAKV
jgi:FkbM family methyltransferase